MLTVYPVLLKSPFKEDIYVQYVDDPHRYDAFIMSTYSTEATKNEQTPANCYARVILLETGAGVLLPDSHFLREFYETNTLFDVPFQLIEKDSIRKAVRCAEVAEYTKSELMTNFSLTKADFNKGVIFIRYALNAVSFVSCIDATYGPSYESCTGNTSIEREKVPICDHEVYNYWTDWLQLSPKEDFWFMTKFHLFNAFISPSCKSFRRSELEKGRDMFELFVAHFIRFRALPTNSLEVAIQDFKNECPIGSFRHHATRDMWDLLFRSYLDLATMHSRGCHVARAMHYMEFVTDDIETLFEEGTTAQRSSSRVPDMHFIVPDHLRVRTTASGETLYDPVTGLDVIEKEFRADQVLKEEDNMLLYSTKLKLQFYLSDVFDTLETDATHEYLKAGTAQRVRIHVYAPEKKTAEGGGEEEEEDDCSSEVSIEIRDSNKAKKQKFDEVVREKGVPVDFLPIIKAQIAQNKDSVDNEEEDSEYDEEDEDECDFESGDDTTITSWSEESDADAFQAADNEDDEEDEEMDIDDVEDSLEDTPLPETKEEEKTAETGNTPISDSEILDMITQLENPVHPDSTQADLEFDLFQDSS